VVHAPVFAGVAQRQLGTAREERTPEFRTNDRAVRVLPLGVVELAAQRRQQTELHVRLADTVFIPVNRDVLEPVLAENPGVNAGVALLEGLQPQERQVNVVVWRGLAVLKVGVEGDVVGIPLALERHAQGAADVLPGPTGVDAVAEFGFVQVNLGRGALRGADKKK